MELTVKKMYWTYYVSTTLLALSYLVVKCGFKHGFLDRFFIWKQDRILEYMIGHIPSYFLVGLLQPDQAGLMASKAILFEIIVLYGHECNIKSVLKLWQYAVLGVIVSMCAYVAGIWFHYWIREYIPFLKIDKTT